MRDLFIGLMSGTSMDGVDGVLAAFEGAQVRVLQHAAAPFPDALRTELMALQASGPDELHRAWLAGNGLMRAYAEVVHTLLAAGGAAAASAAAVASAARRRSSTRAT